MAYRVEGARIETACVGLCSGERGFLNPNGFRTRRLGLSPADRQGLPAPPSHDDGKARYFDAPDLGMVGDDDALFPESLPTTAQVAHYQPEDGAGRGPDTQREVDALRAERERACRTYLDVRDAVITQARRLGCQWHDAVIRDVHVADMLEEGSYQNVQVVFESAGRTYMLHLGDLAMSRAGHRGRGVHAVIRPGLRKTEPELALAEGAAEPPGEFVRPPRRPGERTAPRKSPESPPADGGDAGASEPDSGPAATESPRPAAEVARQKLSLARNYAAAGMTDKARDLVEAILDDYADTSAADGAKALLQQLAAEE